MTTIWKFPLNRVDKTTLSIPKDAKILCVQLQYSVPCLWAMVNPENERVERTFLIYGTGHEVVDEDVIEYLGTFQLLGGGLVFHVFEEF